MIADRFWELLSKQAFAEASEAESNEFKDLLINHPNLKNIADSLSTLAHQSLPLEKNDEAERAFENHIKRIKDTGVYFNELLSPGNPETKAERGSNKKRKIIKWGLIGVVSVTMLFFFGYKYNIFSSAHVSKIKTPLSQVITKPASKTQIQLPDGSTVWLNASSNLTYDKDFGKDFREVNLTGEGFFNVVRDPSHPFIIHTKVIDVKVLGTEFNVRAYPNDAYTETSLIRGRVEITVKNRPDERHYLKPNEKMSVANNITDEIAANDIKSKPFILTAPLTYYHADSTIIETSWVENRLIFQENETFREVALKMERWYGVHISFDDEEVAQIHPFGSFTNETITQALDALRESFRFNYKISGSDIIITK
jgi:ferric-dicitrate binding protein FerR (iron transport regulator)